MEKIKSIKLFCSEDIEINYFENNYKINGTNFKINYKFKTKC